MSDGYDFFGTGTASRTTPPVATWPPAPADPAARMGLGAPPTPATPPPPARSKKPLLVAVAVLVVAAVATSAFFLNRSHPIRLPASAAGIPAVTNLPSSARQDINKMKQGLGKAGIHDIGTAVYAAGGSARALIVAGGHLDGVNETLQQASTQLATEMASSPVGLSSAPVVSGGTTFQCLWAGASGHVAAVCYWWSNTAMLMGMGVDLDAQQTADALSDVRAYAGLR